MKAFLLTLKVGPACQNGKQNKQVIFRNVKLMFEYLVEKEIDIEIAKNTFYSYNQNFTRTVVTDSDGVLMYENNCCMVELYSI